MTDVPSARRTGGSAAVFVIDRLEDRRLLAVTLDASGWTQVLASVDTRTVYVSSSQGNDANDGLSPATAVRSLARGKALVRHGMPDHLLLRRGDVWDEAFSGWTKSGRSPDEPLLIGAYDGDGDPATSEPRPLLRSGAVANAFLTTNNPVDFLYVIGIEMTPGPARGTSNPTGLMLLAPADTLHVEDTVIRGYANNVTVRGAQGPVRDVTFRRSQILDAYATDTHAQGLYAYAVDGLTLEENLFDHNGWSESVPGADPTVFNHNAYVKENVTGFVARGNVFARASSHGLQARSGGVVEGNLFLDNPIGLSFGLVNGSPVMPGGVRGSVVGNAFLGGRDIAGSPRGWAIEVSNTAAGGGGTTIADNLFAHDSQDAYAAIRLHLGSGVSNPAEAVGINDLSITRNTVYGWHAALWLHPNLVPGGVGQFALNGLVVADNDFRDSLGGRLVEHPLPLNAAAESWSGNRYWDDDPAGLWFAHAGVTLALDAWRLLAEPTAADGGDPHAAGTAYPDPTRTPGGYDAALGGAGTTASFLDALRGGSPDHWRPAYAARPVVDYLRQGFGLAPLSGQTPPPPPPTAAPAEVAVSQAGTDVADGATSAISFGSVTQGAAGPQRTFTVTNTGGQTMTLGPVSLLNNAGFAVVTQPATMSLAPRASTSFVLQMSTVTAGAKGATVSFANSDADENPFDFAVTGTVTAPAPPPPEISVLRATTSIADGSTTPVAFGSVVQGAPAPQVTFTINNTGGQPLTLGAVTLSNNSGFSVVQQPASNVAAGGWTTFVLGMSSGSAGSLSADVSLTNNDADENPFNFKVNGTVTAPPAPAPPPPTSAASLLSSTYFGGNGDDTFRDAVVAPDGSVYLAGASFSTDLSLPAGGYDRTANGAGDVLIVHLSADLSTVLHATLLGGSGWEKNTYGIGLDAQGNVYVAGETRSTNFPTTAGALQRTFGGGLSDAFVAKLSGDLSTLHYSTFLGGSDIDAARGGLAVDPASGRVTVVGWTGSTNFPTTSGSYQPAHRGGTYDGFVTRLSADGGSLLWSTFVGGSFGTQWFDSEYVVGATLGTDGSVYLTGASTSSDFPTTAGAYDRTHHGNGDAEAFVGRLSADGKALLWSTLLGGTGSEFTEHRIALDGQGNVVVVGTGAAANFPVTTGRVYGGGANDIFVAKVAAGGGSLLWATLLGGGGEDSGFGPVIGTDGDVYVAGPSTSTNFPVTADALQKTNGGGQDGVFVRLNGASGQLTYATYVGGSGDDYVRFLAGDAGGNFYLTGETRSGNYPTTPAAADRTHVGGTYDAFVTRIFVDRAAQTAPADVEVWYGPRQLIDNDPTSVPFGTRRQFSEAVVYGFTVRNTGGEELSLGHVLLADNTGFEVARQPDAVLAPGASTTFYLRMPTDAIGEKRARVSFVSSDADESPFDFIVTGAVTTQPPEIQVYGNGWELADGATASFPFGSLRLGDNVAERTFTIRNGGGSDLYVQPAQLLNNTGFEIVRQPFHYLTPGSVTYLVLRMRTDLVGSLSANVTFGNTDTDENPFDFRVSGKVSSLLAPSADTTVVAGASYDLAGATTGSDADAAGTFSTRRISSSIRPGDWSIVGERADVDALS